MATTKNRGWNGRPYGRPHGRAWLALALLPILSLGCQNQQRPGEVFQYSVFSVLMEGGYEGDLSIGSLRQHGNIGLGTFNGLDGEMVMVDGKVYRVQVDGKAVPADDQMQTPFATVAALRPGEGVDGRVTDPMDLAGLCVFLDRAATLPNSIYAVRVDGTFEYVRARSLPAQTKPYPPLAEATKGQKIYRINSVKGTLVGFRFPVSTGAVNVPGWHWHFISADRQAGGHVLNLRTRDVFFSTTPYRQLRVQLPASTVAASPQASAQALKELMGGPK